MSSRAPPRCVKCSEASGTVIFRRGHQCPLAVGSRLLGPISTIPTDVLSVTTAAMPSISLADVHQFGIGAIGNFDVAQEMPLILEELFNFSKWVFPIFPRASRQGLTAPQPGP